VQKISGKYFIGKRYVFRVDTTTCDRNQLSV